MEEQYEYEHDEGEMEEELDPQVEYLQQLIRDNEFLQRENLLLEAYLAKVDLAKIGINFEEDSGKKKKSSKKGKIEVKKEQFQKLTDDEKNDLVGQEVELVQAEIDQLKKAGDKDIDDIRTLMEEVDMRIAECKKDTYEFKRDIIIGAENPRTGKILAEKMIRFMEEKLRQKDTVIEKLRLKNSTTKAQIAKMEQQLAHKEEMGEVLHLVDFDQLKIENQQYMEKIEERNNELLRLKLSTSRTVQVLNNLKSRLSDLVAMGQQLRRMIEERTHELAKFESGLGAVGDEKTSAERTVRRLKAEQDDIDNPSIMDYIKLKHDVAELEKQAADWKRKIDIANMERNRTRTLLKSLTSGPQGSRQLATTASELMSSRSMRQSSKNLT
mmetsp:Transcript_10190/g.25401  ORF Transcript_10190/g.25401 Transcript_10190/m.25401 type:complete len:383 (-) Transcript_10190:297-1445(-)|eukprot:CAMPEP_0202863186 /NCGR_PEP_ID=MMETSP1391-20130828/3925_1 /ASSEMBLY_ACC=CAM_ASM_000867 /TAXON_ID=1034604 /ORGANISM="Chlamydomonas leiostraca, Strain SAG 11-49" /LENGTH=382 /DNA_ID=CAMNT_0049542797 /DNA_START=122 /DNA_END=1270 /DNA_ORIENTATION=+